MQLVFFGSDQYSEIVYDRLVAAGYSISRFPHLPLQPSLGVLASYGQILPQSLIDQFPQGILCLHPSLLPQYRGATPVPHAIALGDTVTGITLFRLTAKVDQGEILAQQKENILPSDTSPTLLTRLFTKGAKLLLDHLAHPARSLLAGRRSLAESVPDTLIFTRKLTRDSGFVEWPVIQKLMNNQPISPAETTNELLRLHLTHHPDRIHNTLPDLIRALEGWEKVWTTVETKKGVLQAAILYSIPDTQYLIHISGKPKPISWQDFAKYYL